MTTTASSAKTSPKRSTLYVALLGLASLVVLFQAVWAGLFIREGKDNNDTWVNVHARGADLAIVLAIAAAVVVFLRMRDRRDLLIGTIAFAVALVLEAYLGGLIGDSPAVEVVHFPLALALMGLAVWLPLRARR
jgi:heme A synthase